MTLAEMLAGDPSVKAEHDALIARARDEGEAVANNRIKEAVAKVSPILQSNAYSEAVKKCGIEALVGEKSLATFEAVVVMADQVIEEAKAKAAEGEGGKETPSESGTGLEAAAKYDDKKKRLAGRGV